MKLEQYLALDIGKVKTGIAKADPLGIVIRALRTVPTEQLLTELQKLSQDYEITKLIIGLPINMDNTEGDQAKYVRNLVDNILSAQILSAEIIFEDEKLSSEAAIEELREQGIKIRENNKNLVDSQAAALILRQYFAKF